MKDSVKGTKERAARRVQAATEQARKRAAFDAQVKEREERLVNPSLWSAVRATNELLKRGSKKNTI